MTAQPAVHTAPTSGPSPRPGQDPTIARALDLAGRTAPAAPGEIAESLTDLRLLSALRPNHPDRSRLLWLLLERQAGLRGTGPRSARTADASAPRLARSAPFAHAIETAYEPSRAQRTAPVISDEVIRAVNRALCSCPATIAAIAQGSLNGDGPRRGLLQPSEGRQVRFAVTAVSARTGLRGDDVSIRLLTEAAVSAIAQSFTSTPS